MFNKPTIFGDPARKNLHETSGGENIPRNETVKECFAKNVHCWDTSYARRYPRFVKIAFFWHTHIGGRWSSGGKKWPSIRMQRTEERSGFRDVTTKRIPSARFNFVQSLLYPYCVDERRGDPSRDGQGRRNGRVRTDRPVFEVSSYYVANPKTARYHRSSATPIGLTRLKYCHFEKRAFVPIEPPPPCTRRVSVLLRPQRERVRIRRGAYIFVNVLSVQMFVTRV